MWRVGADADLSHFRGVRRCFGVPAGRFRKGVASGA